MKTEHRVRGTLGGWEGGRGGPRGQAPSSTLLDSAWRRMGGHSWGNPGTEEPPGRWQERDRGAWEGTVQLEIWELTDLGVGVGQRSQGRGPGLKYRGEGGQKGKEETASIFLDWAADAFRMRDL